MSMTEPKRIKFSEEEKFLILEEFSLCKDILIPKGGWYKNTLAWQCAWEEITAAINSLSLLVWCMPDEVCKKWHNIDACRELAVEKHSLLCQRPQEELAQRLHPLQQAWRGAAGPTALSLGLQSEGSQRPPHPPWMLEVTLDLLLHGQSSTATPGWGLLCPAGIPPVPDPMPESLLGAAGGEPNSKESLLLAGTQASVEKRLTPPGMTPAAPNLPMAEMLPVAAPRLTSPQGHGAVGIAPVLPASSPEPPTPFRIKCSPSPVLAWLCLGTTASPAIQSRAMGSPGPLAPEKNGSPSAPEGSQPSLWGRVGTAGERWEKQSWLQIAILELQKETLQLQEKILLEKEKLLLETIRLHTELGT